MDKNKDNNKIEDNNLDKVSGGKVSPECPADGGKHNWVRLNPNENYYECSKCKEVCIRY